MGPDSRPTLSGDCHVRDRIPVYILIILFNVVCLLPFTSIIKLFLLLRLPLKLTLLTIVLFTMAVFSQTSVYYKRVAEMLHSSVDCWSSVEEW